MVKLVNALCERKQVAQLMQVRILPRGQSNCQRILDSSNKTSMKKDTKEQLAKETIFNEMNPIVQKSKAMQALKKAKELEAKQIAAGKKWIVSKDGKTSYLI